MREAIGPSTYRTAMYPFIHLCVNCDTGRPRSNPHLLTERWSDKLTRHKYVASAGTENRIQLNASGTAQFRLLVMRSQLVSQSEA